MTNKTLINDAAIMIICITFFNIHILSIFQWRLIKCLLWKLLEFSLWKLLKFSLWKLLKFPFENYWSFLLFIAGDNTNFAFSFSILNSQLKKNKLILIEFALTVARSSYTKCKRFSINRVSRYIARKLRAKVTCQIYENKFNRFSNCSCHILQCMIFMI